MVPPIRPPYPIILQTAPTPTFDPQTGQLALTTHHLISSIASYSSSFPSHTLLLARPPSSPYQATGTSVEEGAQTSRRKRRKFTSGELESGESWGRDRLRAVEKEGGDPRRAEIEGRARKFAEGIEGGLMGAFEAVREVVEGSGGDWEGGREERVRWIEGEGRGREIDWVGIQRELGDIVREELLLDGEDGVVQVKELMGRIVVNDEATTKIQRITFPFVLEIDDESTAPPERTSSDAEIVVPPSSGFLMSDYATWSTPQSGLKELGLRLGGWDVLLLDPPWPNASATRSSEYDTFDAFSLWKLDVRHLLGEGPSLIAIWITNKLKYRTLLVEKLFPSWGIAQGEIAEWYWIKIASNGEPVFPLDSASRKPYEGLVLGYYNPLDIPQPNKIPKEKVFISTPVGHSRKPVILDLLRPYLPTQNRLPNILELFARTTLAGPLGSPPPSLLPSDDEASREPVLHETGEEERIEREERERGFWMSVGNEALKFNVLHREESGGCKGWLQ